MSSQTLLCTAQNEISLVFASLSSGKEGDYLVGGNWRELIPEPPHNSQPYPPHNPAKSGANSLLWTDTNPKEDEEISKQTENRESALISKLYC